MNQVKIIRSNRRKKTVSARLRGNGVLEVRAPARMTDLELERVVAQLRRRVERRAERAMAAAGEETLEKRARELNRDLFDNRLVWNSIRYVENQKVRWGSCTSLDRTIRLSSRLRYVPSWVRDYVLVHEMAHLLEPDHSPAFWELCNRYRLAERARGYLIALDHMEGSEGGEG